jgi:hypothetical protein
MPEVRTAAQEAHVNRQFFYRILTTNGMCRGVLVKLPISSFVKICSSALKLFHAYIRAEGGF